MKLTKEKNRFVLTGEVQCVTCGGTGLYKGMAERDKSAVICHDCDGTGSVKIKEVFKIFKGRKLKKNIKRVYETAGGYVIADTDKIDGRGGTIRFSIFGVDYKAWLKGKKPIPIKDLHCPYQHERQSLQTKDKNRLYKTRCSEGLSWGGMITNCKHYCNKVACWKIYDK